MMSLSTGMRLSEKWRSGSDEGRQYLLPMRAQVRKWQLTGQATFVEGVCITAFAGVCSVGFRHDDGYADLNLRCLMLAVLSYDGR